MTPLTINFETFWHTAIPRNSAPSNVTPKKWPNAEFDSIRALDVLY